VQAGGDLQVPHEVADHDRPEAVRDDAQRRVGTGLGGELVQRGGHDLVDPVVELPVRRAGLVGDGVAEEVGDQPPQGRVVEPRSAR